ncbi:MAG TPA: hypothetical protein ENH82_18875 [bacterium]|nr:hypothetical protein [bacterium]
MTKVEQYLLEMEMQDFLNTKRDEFAKKIMEDFNEEFKEYKEELEDSYIDVYVKTRLHLFI